MNRESLPKEHAQSLRDMMVQLTAHAIAVGRGKVTLRKLFVAVSSKFLFLFFNTVVY